MEIKKKSTKEQILDALEDKKKISINPPPQNGNCECCGKNIKELKPFGKEGDPLVGNFDGALLVKTFRSMAMPITDKKYLKIVGEYEKKGYKGFEDALIKRFGKEGTDQLLFKDQLANTVEASWECRDCIILNDKEYFNRK